MGRHNFFVQQDGESSEEFQARIIAWKQETRDASPTEMTKEDRDQWVDDHRSGKAGRVSPTYKKWLEDKKAGKVSGSYDYDYPATQKPTVSKVEWRRDGEMARVTWSDGSVEWKSCGEMESLDY